MWMIKNKSPPTPLYQEGLNLFPLEKGGAEGRGICKIII